VVARHLRKHGLSPRCFLVGSRDKLRGDAATTLAVYERRGGSVVALDVDMTLLEQALATATLVVDGVFGTGLDRPVTGTFAQAIQCIQKSGVPCVALDLPSGVDADTGAVLGVAVRATVTVTFAGHKRGLQQHPGAVLAGDVVVGSIGASLPTAADAYALEAHDIGAWLPPRQPDAHKGSAGHVLVVAGDAGRTGAALLAGTGALRAGAGLVTLCPRAGGRSALDAKVLELMTADLPSDHAAALRALHALVADKASVVLGPGFGTDTAAASLLRQAALTLPKPAVLDADALTAFGPDHAALASAAAPRVLTPHPGEAARMLGTTNAQVQSDRYAASRKLAEATCSVVVLKGARTVIASPDGATWVCPLDVPALGVAGTGDVLAGAIGALLCTLSPLEAAGTGVYLHALAGTLAARSDRGLLAHEVADALPEAVEACRSTLSK
jgi:ADP-dependent NAD(P)H-hydrate dehydratase / NAD(P)H-hydrate epimerase